MNTRCITALVLLCLAHSSAWSQESRKQQLEKELEGKDTEELIKLLKKSVPETRAPLPSPDKTPVEKDTTSGTSGGGSKALRNLREEEFIRRLGDELKGRQ